MGMPQIQVDCPHEVKQCTVGNIRFVTAKTSGSHSEIARHTRWYKREIQQIFLP